MINRQRMKIQHTTSRPQRVTTVFVLPLCTPRVLKAAGFCASASLRAERQIFKYSLDYQYCLKIDFRVSPLVFLRRMKTKRSPCDIERRIKIHTDCALYRSRCGDHLNYCLVWFTAFCVGQCACRMARAFAVCLFCFVCLRFVIFFCVSAQTQVRAKQVQQSPRCSLRCFRRFCRCFLCLCQ